MPRVSVVVPTFERPARMPGLIAALEVQTLPIADFDVIIADDGSRDETRGVLEELRRRTPLNLRVVANAQNRGAGATRNIGWRASDAPVIAFTDDDCLPAPRWLETGLARLDDGTVGIVQGRTLPDPSTPFDGWVKTVRIEGFTNKYESCNIFYRTDVLHAVGGFDESAAFRSRAPFGEDIDAGWKARRQGVAAAYAPEVLVHHEVTRPGVGYWWRFGWQFGGWATLVRRFPEMRRDLLKYRVFLARRHAALLGAVFGIAAGTTWPPALALIAPYAYLIRPRRLGTAEIINQLQGVAFDAVVVTGLVAGSVRERTLVL